MFRNSSEKSSISAAKHLHPVREVVVEVDRGDRREQAGGRRDQRLGDARARPRRGWSTPVAPMPWNALMMPHTVPNSPMNGVMLAVVARNGTRRSSLLTSTRRRAQQRAVDARRGSSALDAPRRRARTVRAAGAGLLPQLRVQLRVAGLEDPDERARRRAIWQTACTSENLLLLRKTSRNVAVCRSDAAERPQLVEDDAPGDDREEDAGSAGRILATGLGPERPGRAGRRRHRPRRGTRPAPAGQAPSSPSVRKRASGSMAVAPLGQRNRRESSTRPRWLSNV